MNIGIHPAITDSLNFTQGGVKTRKVHKIAAFFFSSKGLPQKEKNLRGYKNPKGSAILESCVLSLMS
ncbi:hypothetical protein C943_00381 [Mariniradius saccharolyticus AK6]|uniref:Uncharacterized protein n=1 Tax=Mariniradius saccharolyticus AK6 TaxID=1239962 RepID=M7XDZ1_9BACT|nr:hypothetical protein C943_00381 [Mariniradius saccharolyticus AK6]